MNEIIYNYKIDSYSKNKYLIKVGKWNIYDYDNIYNINKFTIAYNEDRQLLFNIYKNYNHCNINHDKLLITYKIYYNGDDYYKPYVQEDDYEYLIYFHNDNNNYESIRIRIPKTNNILIIKDIENIFKNYMDNIKNKKLIDIDISDYYEPMSPSLFFE